MKKIKLSYIIHFLGIIGILIIIFISFRNYYDLKWNSRYTIGITKQPIGTARSGVNVEYRYKVKNVEYVGFTHYDDNDLLIIPNGKYFVLFSSENPENSRMLIHNPVSEKIIESPNEGWSELPK